MPPRLKKTKAAAAAPANGSSLSEPAIKTYFGEPTATKRKGKAPSKKTLLVREGIAQFPHLSPKDLAAELNKLHAGYDFKNNDVSQQKLQLRPKGEKKVKGGKSYTRKAAPVAPAAPTTPVLTTPYIVQLADLAKKVGTVRIREVCDLIDHLEK